MSQSAFKSYALLGSGRLSRHFSFYLQSLNLPVQLWSRNGDPSFNTYSDVDAEARLNRVLQSSSHVLLAVKDAAIQKLAQRVTPAHTAVHFSGAVRIPEAVSAHPLMTFGENLESLDWYRSIPFIIEEGHSFSALLPGLNNPHFALAAGQRAYYHALCSLAGNSTFLLWKQIGDEFERTLNLPRHLLAPFLHQVVANSSQFAETSFTGPVARGDWEVVKTHLESLARRPELLQAYRQYLEIAEHTGHPVPENLL
ncbi:MAG: DUF2520 domain-containing protein [Bdellovibrionales bacterium]|nr:DUF2520 domain-containing protein [Bdellovibrionales bacterium]